MIFFEQLFIKTYPNCVNKTRQKNCIYIFLKPVSFESNQQLNYPPFIQNLRLCKYLLVADSDVAADTNIKAARRIWTST